MEVLEEDLRTSNNHGSPLPSLALSHPPQSPNWTPAGKESVGCNGDEFYEMILNPEPSRTGSPGGAEYQQAPPPLDFMSGGLQIVSGGGGQRPVWAEPPSPDWNINSSFFFRTQLQKEECVLRGVTDALLLRSDTHGRM